MQKLVTALFLTMLTLLTSCTTLLPEPHKLDIQQGNRIKQSDVSKLKIGMTRKQVVFILGTPLLKDAFHSNRWDYIDYFKPGKGEIEQSRLSLIFDNDRLISIDDSHFVPLSKHDSDEEKEPSD